MELMFERLGDLAALPTVAREILAIADDPDKGVGDLLECIEQDPALSANIIRCANSAYYSPREPIGDLQSALAMLGMEQARSLAMTTVVKQQFSVPSPLGELNPERLWDHSVCTAAAARTLSRFMNFPDGEEAYLAALVHDIGLLVIDQHISEQLPRVLVRFRTGEDWASAEREVFSFDHAQLGAYIAKRSGFPESIVEAISLHHSPHLAEGEGATLVSIVAVANYLVTRMSRGSIEDRRLEPPNELVFERLGLNRPTLREAWKAIELELTHVGSLM